MVKRYSLLFISGCLPLLATAQIQHSAVVVESQTDSIFRQYDLDEIVVTGTRTPKFLKDTPIQTRVITSADIAKIDATNVQDLLQQELPGVEFSFSMNQQTHLNFSGFGGQSILFLVDGERLAGETMDDVDFTRLMMEARRLGADAALFGHTHVSYCKRQPDGLWLFNPGSCSAASGSYGIIQIENGAIFCETKRID